MNDKYYVCYYNGVDFGINHTKKLMIIKLHNISDSFTFKEQNDEYEYQNNPTEYKKINNEFIGYNINSIDDKEFLDPTTFKIIDNAKLADFYKKKVHKVKDDLNHYVISYLIFDKYNIKFNYLIQNLRNENVFFGNQQIHLLYIQSNIGP